MHLKGLSVDELRGLKAEIEAEIVEREKSVRATAIAQINQLAAEVGLTTGDLIALLGKKKAKAKQVVAAKYRSLKDPSLTWAGRGRRPGWVEEHLREGGSLEQITV